MASKPANAKQKKWMDDIADWADNNGMLIFKKETKFF